MSCILHKGLRKCRCHLLIHIKVQWSRMQKNAWVICALAWICCPTALRSDVSIFSSHLFSLQLERNSRIKYICFICCSVHGMIYILLTSVNPSSLPSSILQPHTNPSLLCFYSWQFSFYSPLYPLYKYGITTFVHCMCRPINSSISHGSRVLFLVPVDLSTHSSILHHLLFSSLMCSIISNYPGNHLCSCLYSASLYF